MLQSRKVKGRIAVMWQFDLKADTKWRNFPIGEQVKEIWSFNNEEIQTNFIISYFFYILKDNYSIKLQAYRYV